MCPVVSVRSNQSKAFAGNAVTVWTSICVAHVIW